MEYMINKNIESIYWAMAVAGFFGFSLVIAAIVFISVFFAKPDKQKKTDLIGRDVQMLLEQENKSLYRHLGYEWSTNRKFFWLQLHKTQQRVDKEKKLGLGKGRVNVVRKKERRDTENEEDDLNLS